MRFLTSYTPAVLALLLIYPNLVRAQSAAVLAAIFPSAPNPMTELRRRVVAGRYEWRNASLVDLIRTAWDVQPDDVIGGPDWLDSKRFDISIPVPPDATLQQLRETLQNVLSNRFHLKIHSGAAGYLFTYRVVDRTGLSGSFNFDVAWTPRDSLRPVANTSETVTVFDALAKQLGLKLALSSVAEPSIVVDSIDQEPLPNLPTVTNKRQTTHQFEVAEIKPTDILPLRDAPCSNVSIQPVRIVMNGKGLIQEAWGDMNPRRIPGGSKEIESTCYEVHARAPVEQGFAAGWDGPVWNGLDVDSMRLMLRNLLIERFKLQAHMDQRVIPGYVLSAANPKLRTADRSRRPGCGSWLPDDGKDPRISNPVASSLLTCHNVTTKQFAAALYGVFHDAPPIVDETRLTGRYDFSLHFTPPGAFDEVVKSAGNDALELNGAISVAEALRSQLGLRLRSRPLPGSVLVIDRVNDTPTDN